MTAVGLGAVEQSAEHANPGDDHRPDRYGQEHRGELAGRACISAGSAEPWVEHAKDWCWDQLSRPDQINGVLLKFALAFLDAHPDDPRTAPALDALRGAVGADGCMPVPGGTEDKKLTPLALSAHPDRPSRSIFTSEQIKTDLGRLAAEQQDDGGWTFDWTEWCPAQGLDWRGVQTLTALWTLREHSDT